MRISMILKLMMKNKNILFEPPFVSHNIELRLFIAIKFIPCRKDIISTKLNLLRVFVR